MLSGVKAPLGVMEPEGLNLNERLSFRLFSKFELGSMVDICEVEIELEIFKGSTTLFELFEVSISNVFRSLSLSFKLFSIKNSDDFGSGKYENCEFFCVCWAWT